MKSSEYPFLPFKTSPSTVSGDNKITSRFSGIFFRPIAAVNLSSAVVLTTTQIRPMCPIVRPMCRISRPMCPIVRPMCRISRPVCPIVRPGSHIIWLLCKRIWTVWTKYEFGKLAWPPVKVWIFSTVPFLLFLCYFEERSFKPGENNRLLFWS